MSVRSVILQPLAQASDVQCFGGKGSGLAWLVEQGCTIPAGVVLPIEGFDTHLSTAGIADKATALFSDLPTDDQVLQGRCDALQAAINRTALASDLTAALQGFWRQYQQNKPQTALAVRSSAVGEDGQAASFAGQFDSVLNVTDFAGLQQAIRQVWASIFTVHALRYGQHHQRPVRRMAVVLQQQVDAVLSGVLFTRNPAGDDGEMLLECCEGLADKLVAGEVTPVSVVVGKREGLEVGCALPVAIFSKDREIRMEAYTQPLQQLVQQSLTLEQTTGHPLDIEWCITNHHQLRFVQCRPMTQPMQQDGAVSNLVQNALWSNANIAENFPEPVVPLLASFVPRGYAGYFQGLGTAFGIDRSHMDKAADAFNGLVGLQAGHLYYNLSQIFTVIHLVPGGAWLAQSFNLFTGAKGSPVPAQFKRPWYRQLWQGMKIAFHVPRQFLWVKQRVGQFEQMIDEYAAQTQPETLARQPSSELGQHLRTFLDIRENRWRHAALADTAAMVCYAALKALIKRWLPDQEQAHNGLLQGLPGLASARPVEELWQLAVQIRHHPAVFSLLTERSAAEAMRALPQSAPATWQMIQAYLDEWGFRYSGELMLTRETPAENPLAVLQLLQSYLQDEGDGPLVLSQRRAFEREATTERIARQLTPFALLRRLPLPTRAAIFRRLLNATHGAIRLRERARMKQALLYTRLRHVSLALGDQLVQLGWLDARDDVFYLEIDEAIALAEQAAGSMDSDLPTGDVLVLPEKVARRRAERAHCLTLNPPEQMTLAPGEQWYPGLDIPSAGDDAAGVTADSDREVLCGMSACGGNVSGTAAVLTDVTQINLLKQGGILVTRQTDPGWAPVFFLVKGLVIERGGMLSHGAIIAREYGIPAVVGVARATALIENGERLTVDGTQGLVIRRQTSSHRANKAD